MFLGFKILKKSCPFGSLGLDDPWIPPGFPILPTGYFPAVWFTGGLLGYIGVKNMIYIYRYIYI